MMFFLVCSIGLFVGFSPEPPKGVLHKVVLDAGHGGSDPGNLGTGRYRLTEKDITIDVTLRVGQYIKEAFPDVEVIYTRKDDSFPTLKNRVEVANSSDADLFISIHCDAFTKSTAKGSSTFVMGMHKTQEALRVAMKENAAIYREENYLDNYSFDPSDPDTYIALTLRQNTYLEQSLQLSANIQNEFRDRVGRVDRGVKQAGFYVISFTSMPSVLVEMGFLTNPEEEDFLNSEAGRVYMASAIFRAFRDYKNDLDGTVSDNTTPSAPSTPEKKLLTEPTPSATMKTDHHPASAWHTSIVRHPVNEAVRFQVQIVTSSEKLALRTSNFNGLTEVDEYFSDGLYKYAVGMTANFAEAKQMQEILRKNGFDGAFVIAFKANERISIAEALKTNP